MGARFYYFAQCHGTKYSLKMTIWKQNWELMRGRYCYWPKWRWMFKRLFDPEPTSHWTALFAGVQSPGILAFILFHVSLENQKFLCRVDDTLSKWGKPINTLLEWHHLLGKSSLYNSEVLLLYTAKIPNILGVCKAGPELEPNQDEV